ncbi:penicillin acylase family protein [Haloglomus litoreum]|uniref:penicillin acylase family protein n=1 Tax=Haloglomus litoreum TaxID=3034026 RepID=UPI0023E7EBC3|nr:penicillin acylase family protein [Haloglomus sp. DT116]
MVSDLGGAVASVLALALLVSAAVGGGSFVTLSAPASGEAWGSSYGANGGSLASSAADLGGPRQVENPYGEATVRFDSDGVPHISASNERALAFAVGYVQARDRLFQMDLQRRLMEGNLSAAFGARAVESDRFHRQMGFDAAANASWRRIQDTETGEGVRAYTAGVNRYIDTREPSFEFRANGYEPTRWTPQDTLIVGKLIAWQLTGDFRDLEGRSIRRAFPDRREAVAELYPDQLAHDDAIVDGSVGGQRNDLGEPRPDLVEGVDTGGMQGLYEELRPYQSSPGLGSNSWVVGGQYTEDGSPIVANDPHLGLNVPPVWYEQHLRVRGEGGADAMDVRGVAFPGVPTVVIGANDDIAWGFTNVGADQVDLYRYERPSPTTYRYQGEVREFETHNETIPVMDGRDRTVRIRRTVHGPFLTRQTAGGEVGVAVSWVGLGDTRESQAIFRLNKAESLDEVREVMRRFDSPTQNFVAADIRDGGTYFRITGRYPVRTVNGRSVEGDRVFNGTAARMEWPGFEPYGRTNWTAFHDYDEVPEVRNPGYLATANQRTMDDPPFYIAHSPRYADPYRGERIYELLEQRAESDRPITPAYMRRVQQDVRSEAAEDFVPIIQDSTGRMDASTRAAADEFDGWDYNMTADSRPALLYALWLDHYRNATFGDEFRSRGLDESYFPKDYTLSQLPPSSRWFDDVRTDRRERRADIAARALRQAVAEAEREGWETYGDYNRLDQDHPFPLAFLDYPEREMDGSPYTVNNFRSQRSTQAGSSWRMVVTEGESFGIIPGGQSANPFSPHYHSQLDEWATGGYKPMPREPSGDRELVFVRGDGADQGGDGS